MFSFSGVRSANTLPHIDLFASIHQSTKYREEHVHPLKEFLDEVTPPSPNIEPQQPAANEVNPEQMVWQTDSINVSGLAIKA